MIALTIPVIMSKPNDTTQNKTIAIMQNKIMARTTTIMIKKITITEIVIMILM